MHEAPAVIFDVDGVLVDSYDAHFESYRLLADEHGLAMSQEQFTATFGRTTRETILEVWGDQRISADQIRAMDDRKEAIFREIMRQEFPAMEGAVDLINNLHQAEFPLALGSSGPPENIELIADLLGCRDRLGAVVTGRDVSRGKPDPEVFLVAAGRLGVDPSCCLVIEDAPAGLAAAEAAGMSRVGLASTGRTRRQLAGADLVVDSLRELSPGVIQRLIRQRR